MSWGRHSWGNDLFREKALALGIQNPKPGLGLIGAKSGVGKTRIAFDAIYTIYLYESRLTVSYISAVDFAVECQANAGEKLFVWLQPMKESDIFFIDDIGKEKLTEHVAAQLFGVIKHRTEQKLPIVFTSNLHAQDIAEKHAERGPYIVRRLKDFCQIITWD